MLNTNQPESYYFQTAQVNYKQEDNSHIYYNYYEYSNINQNQQFYSNNDNQYSSNNYYDDDVLMQLNESNGVVKNRGGRKQVKQGTTKRNARERNRVRYINNCFEVLREHIPYELILDEHKSGANRKLSKVETLKYAALYIKQLTDLLEESNNQDFNNNKKRFKHENSYDLQTISNSNQILNNTNNQIINNININVFNETRFQLSSSGSSIGSNDYLYSPTSSSSSSYSIY